MRRNDRWAAVLLFVLGTACGAEPAPAAEPRTLEECYMQVALQKTSADLVYLAREICDTVFRRFPRSITVQDPRTLACEEWWFDAHARYETDDRYCALEDLKGGSWKLACQWKKPATATPQITFATLKESGGRSQPVGPVHGRPVGAIFTGLTACVESRVWSAAR